MWNVCCDQAGQVVKASVVWWTMVKIYIWGGLADWLYLTLRNSSRQALSPYNCANSHQLAGNTSCATCYHLKQFCALKSKSYGDMTPQKELSQTMDSFSKQPHRYLGQRVCHWFGSHIPCHAPASGEIKWYNGLLKTTLRVMGGGTFKCWNTHLAKAMWLANTRASASPMVGGSEWTAMGCLAACWVKLQYLAGKILEIWISCQVLSAE